MSRNQRSLSERFPVLQEGTKDVEAVNAILDGEIVALDVNGMPFFGGLRSGRKAREFVIVFQVFDLLYLDDQSLMDESLVVRKLMLKKVLKKGARAPVSGSSRESGFLRRWSESVLKVW